MPGRKQSVKNVTLMDVARAADVAPMTVSRFLNRHPNISEKTARKVSAAIKRLGYSPNLAARMLMGQPSNAIGLIVPNLGDPFFAVLAHNIQEAARDRGLLVWVASSNSDQATEFTVLRQMRQHRVDGILLIPSPGELPFERGEGPPIVMLDRPIANSGCDVVVVENRRSSMEAVQHLVSHGHRRITCISSDGAELYTTRERIAGYEDAMRSHRLKPYIVTECQTIDEVRAYLQAALAGPRPPQAVFSTNNVTTTHVMEAIFELNLVIPEDLALIGFDDFELASMLRPSLTVVRQPSADLGRQAARMLFDRMFSDKSVSAVNISLPPTLILRASCGCPNPRRAGFEQKKPSAAAINGTVTRRPAKRPSSRTTASV
jgi:LacI family transcriptional regulator